MLVKKSSVSFDSGNMKDKGLIIFLEFGKKVVKEISTEEVGLLLPEKRESPSL